MIEYTSKANEFEKHAEGKQIVLFGASSAARHFLLDYDLQEQIRFIVDNDPQKANTKYQFKEYAFDIFAPDIFNHADMENTIIVITSTYHDEITKQLNQIPALDDIGYYNYLSFEHEDYCDILGISPNKKVLICIGAVSNNRGSEALVSTLAGICKSAKTDTDIYLSSSEPTFSPKFPVANIDFYIKQTNNGQNILDSFLDCVEQMDIIIVVGADNYTQEYNLRGKMNQLIQILEERSHAVCIMYDLSIEQDCVDEDFIQSMAVFDYITAREELSYHNLSQYFTDKLFYCPDPAFLLKTTIDTEAVKPYIFDGNTVGINCSDLIISGKYNSLKETVLHAYHQLIEYLLNDTEYRILLIPHVMNQADLFALKLLYQDYTNNDRVILIDKESLHASELKGIISQCQYFIGARTHSIIAAYSNRIPAISIGYSIKSSGIAKDLFGSEADNYIIDVHSMASDNCLVQAFQYLINNRNKTIQTLQTKIPSYCQTINRMKIWFHNILHDKNDIGCCGCRACEQICPANCISMQPNQEGFYYPVTDYNQCIGCGLCIKTCPVENKKASHEDITPEFYCLYSKDSEIMASSSSGGIFSLLAEEVIHNGGVIYGAESPDGLEVFHSRAATLGEYKKHRKSKYLQSDINTCYIQAKKDLEQGLDVLFSGTPCQIAGLYQYLQKEYENLYTLDLTCHGVPSKAVLEQYLKEVCQYMDSDIHFFNWRYKENCWKPNHLEIQFANGKNLIEIADCNGFSRGFLNNLFLRPSCYNCQYNHLPRVADISLGDYFGYEGAMKSKNQNRGLSLAVISTQKGKKLFEAIRPEIECEISTREYAREQNYHLDNAPFYNNKREKFFEEFHAGKSYADLAKEYLDLDIFAVLDAEE